MSRKRRKQKNKIQKFYKAYATCILSVVALFYFVFVSINSIYASSASTDQNSLWSLMMEAFLRGDEARKESLLQQIRESEAAARGAAVAETAATTTAPTTSSNWRDYDWSRYGVTNPAYMGRRNTQKEQTYAETETSPQEIYEYWDPYNNAGWYEETKRSKILTPRFETYSGFSESAYETEAETTYDYYDYNYYVETSKSSVLKPTFETTTSAARNWWDIFRPAETTTAHETYYKIEETTKSNILFSIFGSGSSSNDNDVEETLEAATEYDGEYVVSGSLIKETSPKSRVIDNQVNETTRIISSTRATSAPIQAVAETTVRETAKSGVLTPTFSNRNSDTVRSTTARAADEYEEVVSGSLIKETRAKSRVVEGLATEAARSEATVRETTAMRETTQANTAYIINETTEKSSVLKPEFNNEQSETRSRVSETRTESRTTSYVMEETTAKSSVLTPTFENRSSETVGKSFASRSNDYEEVVSGSLIKETSAKSRVLDRKVTETSSYVARETTLSAQTSAQETTKYVEETEKSNILFSLFGIGGSRQRETTAAETRATTQEETYVIPTTAKPGVLFPIFNNKRNEESTAYETAKAYVEEGAEDFVAGSIFDETKRRARIIDKSADRAARATTQFETISQIKETTFDNRPFEVKWPISIPGEGGWFFLKNVSLFDGQTSNGKIPEHYLKELTDKLERCRQLLGKSKKDFAIILCPDKSAIYKEYYPQSVPYPDEASKIKSFTDYVKAHSNLSVIYPDRAISFVKNVCDLYYKQDSHWNRIAGYIATRELFEMMGVNYNLDSIMSHEISITNKLYPGDLYDDGTDLEYDLKGITDSSYVSKADYSGVDFTNDKMPMHITSHNPVVQKSATVIRDSFIANMLPVLGSHFRETDLYHIENFTSLTKQALQKDVIIIELTARNFVSLYNLADYIISLMEN